jgi:hypothetical protein
MGRCGLVGLIGEVVLADVDLVVALQPVQRLGDGLQ